MIVGWAGSRSILARNWPTNTRRYWVSSLCAGPQTAVRIWPCVITRPGLPASAHNRSYSRGVSLIAAPSRVTSRFSMSIVRPSTATRVFGAAPAARVAQRGAHARQQLADGERLLDVVVGAEVERGDLLRLAVARRQHDDRRGGEAAGARDHVLAVHIGQAEVEDDQVGRRIGDQPQRLVAGGGVQHLVARRFERRLEETHDLRLVVDDQDARAGHDAALAISRASTAGIEMTMRAPRRLTAGLSAQILPPIASTRPRLIDRPRPVPARRPSALPPR